MIALLLAAAAPQAIGVYQRWGAFRSDAPTRCYAIARPVAPVGGDAFASVGNWPGARVRAQVHVRLSRARNPRARVVLAIGERRFELTAGARDAWAPDAAADRAIVAAMRGGRSMSVESVAANGAAFADVYALGGAASAIDAATLGCLRG
ncbi:hypothetical protein [Sphingomonas sp. VNH70]|uniref:hypothetical protein n=1 Tax=Sphingomonas silueang TaxID=3156617 RepID=UPI0032B5FE9B